MPRKTRAQRRAKKERIKKEVAGTRAALPTLDTSSPAERKPTQPKTKVTTSFEEAFAPDRNIVSSTQRGRMSERKSAEERSSWTWRGLSDIEPVQEKRIEALRQEVVEKAIDALQGLELDSDNAKELNRIIQESKTSEEIFDELCIFLDPVEKIKDLDDDQQEVLGGFKDSDPENNRKAREVLRQLKADSAKGIKLRERDGRVRKERSESTRVGYLENRRASKQARQAERDSEAFEDLNDQERDWLMAGHRRDDFPKEQVREEFLPPEPRDMNEPSYDYLPTGEELQEYQHEKDREDMEEEGKRLEEKRESQTIPGQMKKALIEAQKALMFRPNRGVYGGQREGSRRVAAPRALDRLKGRERAINKRYDVGRAEELKRDPGKIIVQSPGLTLLGDKTRDLEDIRRGERYNVKDKSKKKREKSFVQYQEETSVDSIRPGIEARNARRKERVADLGRQRARREKELMRESGMMAMRIAERMGLTLEHERRISEILEGLERKGLTLEDLGKRDIDQILDLAAK